VFDTLGRTFFYRALHFTIARVYLDSALDGLKFDPLLGVDTSLKRVLYLTHFGHHVCRVGKLLKSIINIAAREDEVKMRLLLANTLDLVDHPVDIQKAVT